MRAQFTRLTKTHQFQLFQQHQGLMARSINRLLLAGPQAVATAAAHALVAVAADSLAAAADFSVDVVDSVCVPCCHWLA